VLARYEANAKDFLYPTSEIRLKYHSSQREVFMLRCEFPSLIDPQLLFCTSTNIIETKTPSAEILREYEERFFYDPVVDVKNNRLKLKPRGSKSNRKQQRAKSSERRSFEKHTISSAIKSNYSLLDVEDKLNQLNSTVSSRVEFAPVVLREQIKSAPFVCGRANEKVTRIHRQPSAHYVLKDDLVLMRKSRSKKRNRSSEDLSRSVISQGASSRSRSRSAGNSLSPQRRSKSFSPSRRQNQKSSARAADDSYKSYEVNDASKFYGANKKFDSSYDNCGRCTTKHSDCDVCIDYKTRTQQDSRGQKFHRDESSLSKFTPYTNSLFEKRNPFARKTAAEILEESRFKNSTDFLRRSYSPVLGHKPLSYRPFLDDLYEHRWNYCAPYDLYYNRVYPWYHRYADYLGDLENELYWLKLRSKHIK